MQSQPVMTVCHKKAEKRLLAHIAKEWGMDVPSAKWGPGGKFLSYISPQYSDLNLFY